MAGKKVPRDNFEASNFSEKADRFCSEWMDAHPDQKGEKSKWMACFLYIAKYTSDSSNSASDQNSIAPTLHQLLEKANISIVRFFKMMQTIQKEVELNQKIVRLVLETEKKFLVTLPLYHKFEKVMRHVFIQANSEEDRLTLCHVREKQRLAWSLFLLTKHNTLLMTEIVLAFHLLLCCVDYVIKTTPSFLLNPPYSQLKQLDMKQQQAKSQAGAGGSAAPEDLEQGLAQLCEDFNCEYSEVLSVLRNYLDPLLATPGLRLDDVADIYHRDCYLKLGDFDEMALLQGDPWLAPAESAAVNSPDSTTAGAAAKATPIRSALSTVQALQEMLNKASDRPSADLLKFFNNCSVNPEIEIKKRLERLRSQFVAEFVAATGPQYRDVGAQRFGLSTRLYYRVLGAMLRSEEQRLLLSDFSGLLHYDAFHKSILACSVEVVMCAHGVSWSPSLYTMATANTDLSFPWILNILQLKAYDFYKVLESFIRAEPGLTKDVIKHLQKVETRILEYIAWTSGSPLYQAIQQADGRIFGNQPPFADSAGAAAGAPSQVFLSPVGVRPPYAQQQQLSGSNGGRGGGRSHSLSLFYNKVSRLAYSRLQQLCNLLHINSQVEQYIWTCFEYTITNKAEELIKDRHLDQILLSCVYAVSKVTDSEIKFKTIISEYKNLPSASPDVYKCVWMGGDGETSSIITFYNKIFMQSLKTFILQFQPHKTKPMLSPLPSKLHLSSASSSSPTGSATIIRNNFYLSPLRPGASAKSHMTPNTAALYSFGDSLDSSSKLNEINEAMRAMKKSQLEQQQGQASLDGSRPHKSQKRLKFDEGTSTPSLPPTTGVGGGGDKGARGATASVSALESTATSSSAIGRRQTAITTGRTGTGNGNRETQQ